jgi:hypothetical protein
MKILLTYVKWPFIIILNFIFIFILKLLVKIKIAHYNPNKKEMLII